MKQPFTVPIFIAAIALTISSFAAAEKPETCFSPLPVGSVEPKGWILAQMSTDAVNGMAGHFIELRPKFGSISWIEKDGNGGAGEMGGNWIDGYVRMAYLTGIPEAKKRADDFVKAVLGARDEDGYIGNYPPEKRFNSRMTGELWMQSRIYVALLAYYELTGDQKVLDAVIKATRLTMSKYGPDHSPFHLTPEERAKGKKGRERTVNGHSLMFVDVLEWLYRLTGDRSYPAFAAFLYEDFSSTGDVDTRDIQLYSLMNMKYPFFWHGVHTVEHLRVPLFLAYAGGNGLYQQAAENAFAKLQKHIVPSGSCASDEGVMDHPPLPEQSYEYCTTTELSTSLESALQKTGQMKYADMTERAVFNAAQGARTPDGKCIAYLSSATLPAALEDHDLPYSGTKRHKLSPAHDIGGACCSANAVKIMPYYTCAMWMKSVKDGGLAALLFGPSTVRTVLNGVPVTIDEDTSYPFSDTITFTVSAKTPVSFPLTIRIPEWAGNVRITAPGAEVASGESSRT
ncbi:MAG: beta-L-arabinofuranosidase domain-containing protein, partial [Kiritimatiellales bacterium]